MKVLSEQTDSLLSNTNNFSPVSEPLKIEIKEIQVGPQTEMPIDLLKVIDLVTLQNLDVALAKNYLRQAQAYYLGSYAPLLPSLQVQASVERFEGGEIFTRPNPAIFDRTTFRPTLSGSYQIQTGGKTIFEIKASKNQLNRAGSSLNSTFQKALLNACLEYYTWLKDIASVAVARQSVEEAQAQENLLSSRQHNGFATKLEVLQASTEKLDRCSLLLKAENQRNLSGVILASDLDIPLTVKLIAPEESIHPLTVWNEDLNLLKLFAHAHRTRPDLQELDYLLNESKARHAVARADLFPSLNLSAYYRGIGPQLNELTETRQGLVSLDFNLLKNLGLGIASNMKVNHQKIQEALLKKEKQLNEIEKSLAEAFYNYDLARKKFEVTQQKLQETQEAFRIAKARQRSGVGINLDVIKAQTDLTEARLEYVNDVVNFNKAQLQLMFETGELTPENLKRKLQTKTGPNHKEH